MLPLLWILIRVFVVIVFLACGFLYLFGSLPGLRRYRLFQKLPRHKGLFFFGSALELVKLEPTDFLVWMEEKLKNQERMIGVWVLGFCNLYMKEPKDLQVLLNSMDHINKGQQYFVLQHWLNEGLLTSTGKKWHSRRKILTPAFHFKILEENLGIFNKNAKLLRDKLEEKQGEDVVLENMLTLCTLNVIIQTAMGIDLGSQKEGEQQYVNAVKTISDLFTYRMVRPHLYSDFMFNLSTCGKQSNETVSYLHRFTNNVIKEKRMNQDPSSRSLSSSSGKVLKAFLDRILEYENENPGSFSDSGIREEVDTFTFEGHDTTSAGLIFIFFNLARHPEIQDKVYEELCDIFGDDTDRDVTTSDLQRMVYLEKVIKESLRLHPSVPGISRLIPKDLVLADGTRVPEGTNVNIPIILVHRNEKYWEDPLKFDPERFSEEQIQSRHPYAYVPFSAGPRNCIGQKFAMMELKTVVSTVLRRLKVLPVTREEEIKLVILLVLRSLVPIKCKFVKR